MILSAAAGRLGCDSRTREETDLSYDDYELRWPRPLLQSELERLADSPVDAKWRDRVSVILADAFVGSPPGDDFAALRVPSPSDDPWAQLPSPVRVDPERGFVRDLLGRLDQIPFEGSYAPYYSQRAAGQARRVLGLHGVATSFRAVAIEFEQRGYFENSFGKDCPDDPSPLSYSDVIEQRLGHRVEWLPTSDELVAKPSDLFDLIEVLHDVAAFPRARSYHGWDNCGWHHSEFAASTGRSVYRWKVNSILVRSDLGLRLADDGEDRGRLVATTDPAREDLSRRMASRVDDSTGDRIRHAISLFRARSATEHDKRSACIVLAGVLEERRALLKSEMLSKDEGMLFRLANEFAIRHQDGKQHADYDPVFLDWVYWVFLAAVELSDRLVSRSSSG